jgi:hypothetical protein
MNRLFGWLTAWRSVQVEQLTLDQPGPFVIASKQHFCAGESQGMLGRVV